MKIKGVLVDVINDDAKVVEIEKDLRSYYEVLGCDCIDIVTRDIGNKQFSIICDDEGLFKDPQKISAISSYGEPQLVGNLFVVQYDGRSDEISLTDKEAEYVMAHIKRMKTINYPKGYPILTACEYPGFGKEKEKKEEAPARRKSQGLGL